MDKLIQIREMLSKLAELTKAELTELRSLIGECFDAYDAEETSPDTVAVLNELADAGESVMARGAELEAEAVANEEAREAARARRAKLDGEAEAENADPEDEGGEPEADEAGAEAGAEAAPVAASGAAKPAGSSPSRMAQHATPPTPSPEATPQGGAAVLVASGRGHGTHGGEVIPDRMGLGKVMSKTLEHMSPRDFPQGRVIVASAEWEYPDERTFGENEAKNAELVEAVCHPSALVATGGVCSPLNVDYSLQTWATAERPLRDGLPAFQASRGGLTYRQPPTVASLAGATSIWTEATDASPAGATKPVLAISCASPVSAYVNAVPTRVGFGNMMGQFDPETIAANTDLAIAAAARKAEVELLTLIAAAATADITTGAVLGASRDFVSMVSSVTAQYRNINRLPDTSVLTIVLPRWVKDLIKIDRAKELAHDSVGVDPFMIPDAYIDDVLMNRYVKAIWTLESLPVNGGVYPAQDFSGFTASSALPSFPTKTVWHLFPEGSIQFLDGGRLDLGVVRDSTLDATNDYETFVETFEGIANRAFSGGVLQLVSTLCANGTSSSTLDVHTTCI
jgi:hypothetical protein